MVGGEMKKEELSLLMSKTKEELIQEIIFLDEQLQAHMHPLSTVMTTPSELRAYAEEVARRTAGEVITWIVEKEDLARNTREKAITELGFGRWKLK